MSMRSSDQGATLIPVSEAVRGFAPARAAELLERLPLEDRVTGGDVDLFVFLNFGEALRVVTIAR